MSELTSAETAQQRWNKKNRVRKAASDQRWREANRQYQKDWDAKNPGRRKAIKRKHILKQYKLSQEEYDALLARQEGHCAFPGCQATEFRTGQGDSLAVDHDHESGAVRGLLCYRHNILVGLARDSVEELEAAIAYLRRHK